MNLKKLMGGRGLKNINDSSDRISLSKFSAITGWDDRYDSGEGGFSYGSDEHLRFIDLQFFNGRWIYAPRIVWRGTYNTMSFPMVAQKGNAAVVINNTEELGQYAELWRSGDFSMLNRRVVVENYKSGARSYPDFIDEVKRTVANDRSIVYVVMDEDEHECKFYKVK